MTTPRTDFMVIDFGVAGQVSAMHRDRFSLDFLGKQSIKRASDIRFNDDTQKWDIHLADGDLFVAIAEARDFDNYDSARKMEVSWLEHCRLHHIEPRSEAGLRLLQVLRAE